MSQKETVLAYLESLQDQGACPEVVKELDEQTLLGIKDLVDSILARERAGLDSLFSSMTHTMKFIPNILLQSLTARYIEAPIAARITEKLSTKQAVAVANGLKPEYIAETSRYMSARDAALLLSGMQGKKAAKALGIALESHPEPALALIECLDQSVMKRLVSREQIRQLADESYRERLEALYR